MPHTDANHILLMNVPRDRMPEGAKEGDWVELDIVDGEIASIASIFALEDETEAAEKQIADKLEQLRNRRKTGL